MRFDKPHRGEVPPNAQDTKRERIRGGEEKEKQYENNSAVILNNT
jgi:hypothetical protein